MSVISRKRRSINALGQSPKRLLSYKVCAPWLMWIVVMSFVLFQFFLQLSAGAMVKELMMSFHVSVFSAGFLVSAFYFIYVILQTPAGMLVDLFKPRYLLTGGGLVCSLGCLLFAISHTYILALIGRALMGLGSAFAFVSSLYIVSKYFPARRFALMLGLAETMGMLGVLIGNVCFAKLLQHYSWRTMMLSASIIAVVIAALCWHIIYDEHSSKDLSISLRSFWSEVLVLIRNGKLWLNGLFAGLLFSVVTVFAALWGVPFLVSIQHVSLSIATFESSSLFVGIALGCPFMGWLFQYINRRNLFLATMAISAALMSIWIIYFTPYTVWLSSVLFFLLGLICSSYVFNYTLANKIAPPKTRTTSMGFTNTLCVLTAPILQPLAGFILHEANNQTVHGHFSITAFHVALSVIPGVLMIAAVIAFYLPEDQANEL